MSADDLQNQRTKPAHEIKIARIRASIWANLNAQQGTWYSVSIVRVYQDGDGWKEATSFGRDDLPLVCKVAEMAYAWIWSQRIESRERSHVRT